MKQDKPKALKRIRENCLECSGGTHKEAKLCPVIGCPLWQLRFGCSPKAAVRRLGEGGSDFLDESCFIEGGKFGPTEPTSETGV